MKYWLSIFFINLFTLSCLAVDISYDGRIVQAIPGKKSVKWITLMNREELPRWVRVVPQKTGPMPSLNEQGQIVLGQTALGWTYTKEGWMQILPHKVYKLRVEFQPPYKIEEGEYGIWLIFEQMNDSPEVLSEEIRGKSLEKNEINTYYLPLLIQVQR